MNKRYPALLFFFAAFFCAATAFAQLHIVKDNVACLYGLKNEKNEWVVPAKFQMLRALEHQFFASTVADKQGLLNPEGKEIAAPKYYYINLMLVRGGQYGTKQLSDYLFRVSDDRHNFGLLNGKGEFIYPVKYKAIINDGENAFILQDSAGYSAYVSGGQTVFKGIKGIIAPFGGNELTATGMYYSSGRHTVSGNAGVINRSGKTIIEPKYDAVSVCHASRRIAVQMKGKTGFFDFQGQEIMPVRYVFMQNYGSGELPCLFSGNELMEVSENDLLGLMNSNGELVAPCAYEELTHQYPDFRSRLFHWLVKKNKRWGTLGENGEQVIAPVYDTLVRLGHFKEAYMQGRQLLGIYFIAQQNGKWGLLDERGNVLVPLVHDKFMSNWHHSFVRHKVVIFPKGHNLVVYDYEQKKLHEPVAPKSRVADSVLVYRLFPDELFVLPADKKNPGKIRIAEQYNGPNMVRQGFVHILYLGSHVYLLRRDGSKWMGPEKIRNINPNVGMTILTTTSGRIGVLGISDKKLLVDTVYAAVAAVPGGDPFLFWVKPVDRTCRTMPDKSPCWCGWAVADTSGKLLTTADFAEPVAELFSNKVQVIATNDGVGIYSGGRKKYLLPPLYKAVEKVDANFYKVFTWSDRMGITDSSGNWLTDTVWANLFPVSNEYIRPKTISGAWKLKVRWWLLSGPGGKILINEHGKQITGKKEILAERRRAASLMVLSDTLINNIPPYIDSLPGGPSCSRAELQRILDHEADKQIAYYDSLFAQQPVNFPLRSCYCFKGGEAYNSQVTVSSSFGSPNTPAMYQNQLQYGLVYAGSKGYTMHEWNQPHMYEEYHWSGYTIPVNNYYNYHYRNGEFVRIELTDLLSGDIKTILQNELVTALQKRDDLNLDCHAADKLFELTENRFSLSDAGLVLYLPGPGGYYGIVGLTIPWKNLKPHAKAGSIVLEMQQ